MALLVKMGDFRHASRLAQGSRYRGPDDMLDTGSFEWLYGFQEGWEVGYRVILAFQAHTDWTMDVEAATRNFNSNDVALDTYRKILSARSRNGRSLDFQYGAASNTSYSFCEALYIRSTCA
jgi:hypothetical protein